MLRAPRRQCLPAVVMLLVLPLLGMAGCSKDIKANLQVAQEKQALLASMRVNLLLAVEAGNNALLSPVDNEAKRFAAKAGMAMAAARDALTQFAKLVPPGKNAKETDALDVVTTDFSELGKVHATLQGLVGRNSNLKAAVLSRTEAALAVNRLQQVLSPVIDGPYCPAAGESLRLVTAALSILALHAQHIDEKTVPGMDNLEAAMNRLNANAQAALEHLAGMLPPDKAAVLTQARGAYADLWRIHGEVIRLSRENSNIEAQALAMGRRRLLVAKTLDDLSVLDEIAVRQGGFTATR